MVAQAKVSRESVAFTSLARVVMVAVKVNSDDGEERRNLARSKSNIGPDDGGYEYTLDQGETLPGIFASLVTWGASVNGTARELLTDPNEAQADVMSAIESARAFLLEVLKDGITPCKTIQAEAKAAGLSWSSICRASNLMVVVKKKGIDAWYWKLNDRDAALQGSQEAQLSKRDFLELLDANPSQSTRDEGEVGS